MQRKTLAKKALTLGCVGMLAAAMLAGCGSAETTGSSTLENSVEAESTATTGEITTGSLTRSVPDMELDTADMFTERDLEGTYDESEAVNITLTDNGIETSDESGVTIDGQTITIKEEGVYVLSGSLSDGQVIVDADDTAKIQIVLNNADITSKTSAAVYVKNADKVFLTAAEGSKNSLSNSDSFESDGEEEIDGVIYAKDDITINGPGSLNIETSTGNGATANDDLVLAGTKLTVDAGEHAVKANDSIRVADGTYDLTAGKDALHTSNDEEVDKGFIYIQDGSFTINSESDGMDATGMIQIDDGSITVKAKDDGIHSEAKLLINGGNIDINESTEGLEGYDVIINDGDINITSSDDGINATDGSGGEMMGGMMFEGTNPEKEKEMMGNPDQETGTDQMLDGPGESMTEEDQESGETTSKEMMDKGQRPQGQMPAGEAPTGQRPQKPSGDIAGVPSSQDENTKTNTDNTNDSNTVKDQETKANTETTDSSEDESLVTNTGDIDLSINGGDIHIETEGDGIDSNGTITITGGTTIVEGPTNNGNGSMDTGDGFTATITGGVFAAAGSSGMAETFGSDSTQGVIMQNVDATTGEVTLADADGNELISFETDKTYSNVIISTPEIKKSETYTLTTGGKETTIEMTDLIMGTSQGMGGQMPGGMQGQAAPNMQKNTESNNTK